jgi:hypothetical protein
MPRPVLMVAAAVLAAAVAAAAAVLLTHSEEPPRAAASSVKPTARELDTLGSDVTSGSRQRLRVAFLVPRGQKLEAAFLRAVRQWRRLELDFSSYDPAGESVGTVDAALTDGSGTSEWVLTIQRVDGQWHILSTEPAR